MMYLSQILKNKVYDSTDTVIGSLREVLVRPAMGRYAPLLFLVVETKKQGERIIPYEYVATIGREGIALKNVWVNIPVVSIGEGCVFLNREIMDEQIVDVEGARVVRVNDLKLGVFENKMCVLGIDVSFKAILRRLHAEWLDMFFLFKVILIDWRKAQLVKGTLQLDTISKDLIELHPADLANIIEDLTVKQGSKLVRSLTSQTAAQVVEEMNPELQKTLIHYLGPERAAGIMQNMSIDETVDLLKMLPRGEARLFLSSLQGSKLRKVEKLINYPDDTAGGLMTTEYVSARPEWTVERAIEEIKRLSPTMRSILYVYLTDENGLFGGAISLRRLVVANSTDRLAVIATPVPDIAALRLRDNIEDVIKTMTKYDLYTAAVLDEDNRMVGMVTIDDVMRHMVPNA